MNIFKKITYLPGAASIKSKQKEVIT